MHQRTLVRDAIDTCVSFVDARYELANSMPIRVAGRCCRIASGFRLIEASSDRFGRWGALDSAERDRCESPQVSILRRICGSGTFFASSKFAISDRFRNLRLAPARQLYLMVRSEACSRQVGNDLIDALYVGKYDSSSKAPAELQGMDYEPPPVRFFAVVPSSGVAPRSSVACRL